MTSITIVDDNPLSLSLAKRTLERAGFESVLTYSNPNQALRELRETPTSIVLVDYVMSEMDGLAFIEALRREMVTQNIPAALMSDSAEVELVRSKAFSVGAVDVLRKPLNIQEAGTKLLNLARIKTEEASSDFDTNQAAEGALPLYPLENSSVKTPQSAKSQELQIAIFLQRIASVRDERIGQHTSRMAQYAGVIAESYGLDIHQKTQIVAAAPLHDIGMVSVPDSILLRSKNLQPDEWELMKLHTIVGHQLLKNESLPLMNLAAEIALSHHERWDGLGYPRQLKGEQIPIAARIVAVADVFDCMSCTGQEGQAQSMKRARELIISNSELHFDPEVVAAFIKALDQIQSIKTQFDRNEIFLPTGTDVPQMLQLNL